MRFISVLDIRELIRQFRAEQSMAAAAQAVGAARNTAARYRRWAKKQGWLDNRRVMPSEEEIAQALEQIRAAVPQTVSRLDPYREAIQTWREQGINISAVRERLKQPPQGITCSYSTVWTFVQKLEGPREEAVMRLETSPGEEAQVDFGYARSMYDPLETERAQDMGICDDIELVAAHVCGVRVRSARDHLGGMSSACL